MRSRLAPLGLIITVLGVIIAAACSSDDRQAEPAPAESAAQAERQSQPGPSDVQETQETQQAQAAQPAQSAAEQPESQPEAQAQAQQAAESQSQSARQEAQEQASPDDRQDTQDTQEEREEETPAEPETRFTLGGDRPATLILPAASDESDENDESDDEARRSPRPLIVLLHGYGSNSVEADGYFGFSRWVDDGRFGLLLPNGTVDEIRNQFWNATPECCDISGAGVDDVAYLTALIEEARSLADFDQVFAVGHSNGGFMAYRLACEGVPGLRGIVSLAGGAFADPDDCRLPEPLSVLQIHGNKDAWVLYEGGRLPNHPDPDREPVPGAWESAARWAERAGCDIEAIELLTHIDTDSNLPGDDTSVKRMLDGCAEGVKVELWTIEGGGHIPWVWGTDFSLGILTWLESVYVGDLESLGSLEPNLSETNPAETNPAETNLEEHEIGGERPTLLVSPKGVDGPLPLIVSLHGYSGEASAHDWYFGLSQRVAEYGFALITPQGLADRRGNAFWNATDYCCNFDGAEVDDAGYIASLVEQARGLVDIGDVYVVGYSNGGFMAYRLACEGLEGLVAIASLAGSEYGDRSRCDDAPLVSVLQIHGDADLDIPYAGTLGQGYSAEYPGAQELLRRWAERAGCRLSDPVESLERIDLDRIIEGPETRVERFREGCAGGVVLELWTIEGGDHGPYFQDDWPDRLLTWLLHESRAG